MGKAITSSCNVLKWAQYENSYPILVISVWSCFMGNADHPLQYKGINNIKLSRSKQKICQENCD